MKMAEDQGPGMAELSQDLSRIREDLGKLTDTVANMLTGRSGSVAGRVMGAMEDTRQTLSGTADTAMQTGKDYMYGATDKLREASGQVEASIERNPLTAVMVAAALGLVVGMMGRNNDRR